MKAGYGFRRLLVVLALLLTIGVPGPIARALAAPSVAYLATIPPLAAILREVVGERGVVDCLLPSGGSPHTFQPRPSDLARTEGSLAFFMVGPNLDQEWAGRLPAARTVVVLSLIPRDYRLELDHHHDLHHGKESDIDAHESEAAEAVDPHFWTDPLTVKAMLPALIRVLIEVDPAGEADYRRNGARFGAELELLHQELGAQLGVVRNYPFFMFHPSFQYLFKRYDLHLAGLIEPFPGREPGPKFLHGLINRLKASGAKALFSEVQLPKRPAQVLGEAAGVRILELDPLGGKDRFGDYAALLRYNASILVRAKGD